MKSDVTRWNSKYERHRYTKAIQPDPILTGNHRLLSGRGIALDLASGVCDNASYLSSLGYLTVALDASIAGLRLGKRKAEENGLRSIYVVADLDAFPLPADFFDVVVICRYLNREIVGPVKGALKYGGLLFFKTFNETYLDQNPSFPIKYVLRSGELHEWFGEWTCIDSNESRSDGQTQSFWVGRKT